jgi:hypothetical protein
MRKQIFLGLILVAAAPAWSQVANTNSEDSTNVEDRMLIPAPVSGEAYSVALDSQEHTNYLHYGVTFSDAYSDNVLGGSTGHAVSDMSYSAWPTIGVDETTSRLHWGLTYAPGFTFYQNTSERNEADQNALLSFQYRLSPHVTFSVRDTFQKSSNVFNQPSTFSDGTVSGGAQGPNLSVIAPIADRLSNFGNVGITYQYSVNDMIGTSGSFGNLHYTNPAQVSGLSDESSQTGSAFYSHRVSKRHYFGATYQYQRLMSYPTGLSSETQTHAILGFYTMYVSSRTSVSLFGGPQYADTVQPALPSLELPAYSAKMWSPAAGASVNWQGRFTSAAVSYSHAISGGSGLIGAVRLDQATAITRLQFSRTLRSSFAGSYANNNMIGTSLVASNGHTFSATAALQRDLAEHLRLDLGYTRLHQTYNIPLFSATPDTNREFISISYDFARPLGR